MSALDDALNRLATELKDGFSSLHSHVDELHDQIAELEGDNADELQAAASRIDEVVSNVEASFASFTQHPDVPVEPVPDPAPADGGPVVSPTDNTDDSGENANDQ